MLFRVAILTAVVITGAFSQTSQKVYVAAGVAAAPKAFRAVATDSPVRVRASADGVNWSEWLACGPDNLPFFGADQHFLETDGAGEVLLIDPGPSPSPAAAKPTNRFYEAAAPPIVTRAQWGCTPQNCPAKDAPVYTVPTHLIVHHTATSNTAADWSAVMRSIWVLHVQGNGWNDIGYNYLIDPNGLLYEGRAGGDGVMGAHFSAVNGGTMGVSVIGTYQYLPPTAAAVSTLRDMLVWQAQKWKLDPGGIAFHASSSQMLNVISGHRDANNSTVASGATECPGTDLYVLLPRLRREVRALLACPVTLSEENRCVTAAASSWDVSAAAPQGCAVTAASKANWLHAAGFTLSADANTGARRTGIVNIGGQDVSVTQSAAAEPLLACVSNHGIVNAASYTDTPVAPNSIVSVFGRNFGDKPTLAINGKATTVLGSTPTQINAVVPSGVQIGTAKLAVSGGPDAVFSVTEAAPAIFTYDGVRAVAASAGGYVVAYLTGGGATGETASATLGGKPAVITYLGPAPGFTGVHQLNLQIPAGLAAGDSPLVLTVRGIASNGALVTLQ